MLSEGPQNSDSNFDESKLKEMHNGFLLDQYINLTNRVLGKKIMK
jgi:methionyl-tRNA synthetase